MLPVKSQRANKPYWPRATNGLDTERPIAMIIKHSRNKFLVLKVALDNFKTNKDLMGYYFLVPAKIDLYNTWSLRVLIAFFKTTSFFKEISIWPFW